MTPNNPHLVLLYLPQIYPPSADPPNLSLQTLGLQTLADKCRNVVESTTSPSSSYHYWRFWQEEPIQLTAGSQLRSGGPHPLPVALGAAVHLGEVRRAGLQQVRDSHVRLLGLQRVEPPLGEVVQQRGRAAAGRRGDGRVPRRTPRRGPATATVAGPVAVVTGPRVTTDVTRGHIVTTSIRGAATGRSAVVGGGHTWWRGGLAHGLGPRTLCRRGRGRPSWAGWRR